MPNLVGKTLKWRYRVEELVGQGGMSEVYRSWDTHGGYAVAIKVILENLAQDPEFVGRFQREAHALAALSHRNIIRFYSFEREGDLVFIVMDYVQGRTLRRRIHEAGGLPLPLVETLSIAGQVSAALHYAHQAGVIHRDVKPGNIMIRRDPRTGASGQALVADFGIARAVDAASLTAVTPGTPAYMSPEQCRSQPLDARSDVYSLGVVTYEMLAGRKPFIGDRARVAGGSTRDRIRWEQVNVSPLALRPRNPEVLPAAEAVVLRALAKDPEQRWISADAFWHALSRSAGAEIPGPPVPTPSSRSRPTIEPGPPAQEAPARQMPGQPGARRAWLAQLPPLAWMMAGSLPALLTILFVLLSGGAVRRPPTLAPPPAPPPAVTTSIPEIAPGYHPVGRSMGIEASCAGRPFGSVQLGLEGVEALGSGELRFNIHFLWQISSAERQNCPDHQITINSDQFNQNMYIVDQDGVRYHHKAVGGAAAENKLMEPNVPQQGWFLFSAPLPGARVFSFHDADNGTAIQQIDLGP